MKHLFRHLRKYRVFCVLAPLFKMLEASFDLLVPIVVAQMIDEGVGAGDKKIILRCFLTLVTMAIVGLVCSFVAQFFAAKAATGGIASLRSELFERIMRMSATDVDSIGVSTLITRMTGDADQIQNGVNLFLRLFLRSPFVVIGAAVMSFTINFRAALIFVITIPVLSLIVFGVMRLTSPRYKKVREGLDKITQSTRENLSGARVIRAFGMEDYEVESFGEKNDSLVLLQTRVGRLSALMNPLTYVVINLGIAAVLLVGSNAVNSGVLLSGSVIALVNYMSQILVELVKLANLIVTLSKASASLSRAAAVLEEPGSPALPEDGVTEPSGDTAVSFGNVCLRYVGAGEESLTDISFTVKRGETVGIIGATGSGKSSLISLIPGFYLPTSGTVSVLGSPLTSWSGHALRERVGIVPQKALLFSGTVRSNLLWGNESASEDELWDALKTAQAEDFVRLKPLGLDEPVEQGGKNLSGGQRQRLTIARALVSKPDILILDDSSSALDYSTDAALRSAIAGLTGNMTVFIISQRTSGIRRADKILVLDDGRLIGNGTHDELLQSCEVYREIHESQFGGEVQ